MTPEAPIPGGNAIDEVTDRTFETDVEKSLAPVVVMFYANICPHCRAVAPLIESLAREFRGRVRFVRIDVEANPWTSERYGVRGTPTFKFFCRGRPVQELVGAVTPTVIRRFVEEFERHGEQCIRTSTEIDYEITGYG